MNLIGRCHTSCRQVGILWVVATAEPSGGLCDVAGGKQHAVCAHEKIYFILQLYIPHTRPSYPNPEPYAWNYHETT